MNRIHERKTRTIINRDTTLFAYSKKASFLEFRKCKRSMKRGSELTNRLGLPQREKSLHPPFSKRGRKIVERNFYVDSFDV
jgi:hypothetical protein